MGWLDSLFSNSKVIFIGIVTVALYSIKALTQSYATIKRNTTQYTHIFLHFACIGSELPKLPLKLTSIITLVIIMYDKGMAPGTRIIKKKNTLFLLSCDLVLAASLPVPLAKQYLLQREERLREWKGR